MPRYVDREGLKGHRTGDSPIAISRFTVYVDVDRLHLSRVWTRSKGADSRGDALIFVHRGGVKLRAPPHRASVGRRATSSSSLS